MGEGINQSLHVMVVGLGGVGSWCAEALARSGVGQLSLVDFDDVCVTNVNRQLHTLTNLVGKKKAIVMAERIGEINPRCRVYPKEQFFNKETSDNLLNSRPDLVIDCIDNLTAKCHLHFECRSRNIKILGAGGTGGKFDPALLRVADLSETHGDPFLQQLRKTLRVKYGFPRKGPMGVPFAFSLERPIEPKTLAYDGPQGFKCVCYGGANDFHSCEKRPVIWGTASFLTGAMGLLLASRAVMELGVPHLES